MKKIASVAFALILTACASKKEPTILSTTSNPIVSSKNYMPFVDVTEYSDNSKYGYSEKFPIKVGGVNELNGPSNQHRFLASLAGPNGEEIRFHRRGSCCPYPSKNGFDGVGLLDVYEVTYEGLKKPILLYITMYDKDKLYIPKDFTRAR